MTLRSRLSKLEKRLGAASESKIVFLESDHDPDALSYIDRGAIVFILPDNTTEDEI